MDKSRKSQDVLHNRRRRSRRAAGRLLKEKSHQPTTATGGVQDRRFTPVYKRLNLTERVQDSAKNWELRFPFQTSDFTP